MTNLNTNDPIFEYRSRLGSEQQGDFSWQDREKTGGSAQWKNGSLSFDTNGVKDDPMVATCMTPNPVFFYHSMTSDGRLAIAEHPYREENGTVVGEYAIRILR